MPDSRAERRRKGTEAPAGRPPVWRRREFINGAIVAAIGVVTVVAAVILLGGGGDGSPGPAGTGTPVVFVPQTAEDVAIDALARRTVEALPNNEWPPLYASFTQAYRDRCSEADFVAAGQQSAVALGAGLSLISYVRLENVEFVGDSTANMVIVGKVPQGEYTLQAVFEKVDGAWKIAPNPGTTGCNAFSRLTDPPTPAPGP